jgi:two-component system, OmpR family, sensor histidine kinase KdpD
MTKRDDDRPDPDKLLADIVEAEALANENANANVNANANEKKRTRGRGRLRIYFGSSAGVGKTYAMLQAARKRQAEGKEVLIGIVETHGRSETLALVNGLTLLSRKQILHHAKLIEEFDLDAALAARPDLILIDEFAHSNAPGSRHPKRWQDVDELRNAGIDVFTTLNVQHLESLNDVIGGITGIRVNETVPDKIFDTADEVILVDITADELLSRLKAGKVYMPRQAEHAAKSFFRKGNLMALREIALRRTADRVENDVEAYREAEDINRVWKTDAALLACVSAYEGERVVRSAARLAGEFGGRWHVAYVETPQLQRLPKSTRDRILKTLKLAESLGATTAVLSGDNIAHVLTDYAKQHNFSRILIGRRVSSPHTLLSLLRRFKGASLAQRIADEALDVDLIEVSLNAHRETNHKSASSSDADRATPQRIRWQAYVVATLACVATTLLATPLVNRLDLANIVMLFLLVVVFVGVKYGRAPAVYSALLGVVMFDFFFVPPRFSFAVNDVQYLVTFGVMLAVGLITGQLTATLRYQARVAASRETRARLLYEFSRDLSGALQVEQVLTTTTTMLEPTFRAQVALLLPNQREQLITATKASFPELDMAIAQWSFDKNENAGYATGTLPTNPFRYIPLKAPMRVRGVLAIRPDNPSLLLVPEQSRQLETYAVLIAITLERIHYIEVAQGAIINIESEKLRNNLLTAMSHDLRTPLTALVGLAESLALNENKNASTSAEIGAILSQEARRMATLVENLLDMARLQSGVIRLKRDWLPIEEVIGSAIQSLRVAIGARIINVTIDKNCPLIEIDAVLIERVLANLIENAVKYTPEKTPITISVKVVGAKLQIEVSDMGPGVLAAKVNTIFDKFTRGDAESAMPGVGLGLAICRAIVEAHGGKIWVTHNATVGATFTFTLPLGSPPAVDATLDIS